MYIHKGVTERFGFDDSRISQILNSLSRTKQRERPVGCLYTALIVSCRFITMGTVSGRLYDHIGVGLSTLLVSTNRAMREPLNRGTGDRTGSTFLCIWAYKSIC